MTLQELRSKLQQVRMFGRQDKSLFDAGIIAVLDGVLDLLEAQEQTLIPPIHGISSLQLNDSDILVVKLGDPGTGWIPGAEYEQATLNLFNQALKRSGTDAVAVITHYAVELQKLTKQELEDLLERAEDAKTTSLPGSVTE